MAGRKSNVLKSREETKPKPAKRQRQSAGLNALAAAEDQFPTKAKFRPHRFGEVEDFSKRKRDYDDDDSENKRRRTEEDEDEDLSGRGSDSEGHEWKVGQVDSDDDSDIDSDDALGSSDEERFEGFTFRGSSKPHAKSKPKAAKRKEINLSEDDASDHEEDDDDDSLGEDAVDLATAWDMNAQEDSDEDDANNTSKGKPSTKDASSESDLGDSEDEESDIDSDTDLSMSDDDKVGTKDGLSKLRDFVSSMETTKPRERPTKSSRGQENVAPTEYGLTPSRKLTVSELFMASGMDSRLKSSLKHLDSAVPSKDPKVGTNGKLTAPLPKRQQDRIDRAAAYDKSKETLNRWIDTVKSNREAEHISFPLPDPYEQQVSRLGPVAPKTDLESTIQSILVESGLATSEKATETQLQAAEDLQTRKMSLEEVQARTAELRKRRDLLFREEIRAKRIKKIKSKSYRRVHRKERQKMEELEQQALIDAGVEPEEKEREQYDRLRAEARMSTKHRDSKWAKSLKQTGRTAWDEDARTSMTDLARRDEELQRRMEGRSVRTNEDDYLGSSSSESDDENDAWDEEDSDFESRKLNGDLDMVGGTGSGEPTGPHSKLLSMAFMQRAEASRKQQNDDEIKNIRKELNGDVSGSDSDQEGGRKKFGTSKPETGKGPVASRKKNEFEETVGSEDEDLRNEATKEPDNTTLSKKNKKSKSGTSVKTTKSTGLKAATRSAPETEEAVENPWLVQNTRNNRKRDVGEADQALDISVAAPIDESTSRKPESQSAKSRTNRAAPQHDDESSDSNDNTPVLLKNHDLVKRAFAGDDVIAEFKKEKEEVIEEEGDKIIDNTLPGWGSWTGAGVSKKQQRRQKRFLTKVEGVRPEQRKDARLGHVIINEKRVKKNARYMATQLPHPFENRQQYERSLRLPIGPEWSTSDTFHDATKPRVLVKQGIIKPMERPQA